MSSGSESIYNLIAVKEAVPSKAELYRSKYPGNAAPTASTFGAATTSTVGVTNLRGKMAWNGSREHVLGSATLGPAHDGGRKPRPDMFLKSKSGTKALAKATKFSYPEQENERKPALPKRDEAPAMGLKTTKNFVISNALENILSESTAKNTESAETLKHAEFGKVPQYLTAVKKQINAEYQAIAEMKRERESKQRHSAQSTEIQLLPEEDRVSMLNAMKQKWERINSEYQQMTHLVALDTISKIKRKERFEAELSRLERDIQRFSKKHVFIRSD